MEALLVLLRTYVQVVSPDLAEPLVNWDAATDKHLNTNEPQYLLVTDDGVLLPATPITVISSPAPSSTIDEVINNAISVLSESESTTKTSATPVADGTKAAIGHNNVSSTTTSHIITNETTLVEFLQSQFLVVRLL